MIAMLTVPEEILTRRLRRHAEGDVEPFVGFMTDPNATRFIPFDAAQRTASGAEAMLLGLAELYGSDTPVFSLTITLLGVDRYLGSCGLSPTDDEWRP